MHSRDLFGIIIILLHVPRFVAGQVGVGENCTLSSDCVTDANCIGNLCTCTTPYVADEDWTACIYSCEETLIAPANGTVDTTEGNTVNDVAYYSCDEGLNLNGDATRTCDSLIGGWTGTTPTCEEGNACDMEPCLNGATCTFTMGQYTCICAPGYESRHCDVESVPDTCDVEDEETATNGSCIRRSVLDLQNKASSLNANSSSDDIADFLDDLSDITNATTTNTTQTASLTQGELETLAGNLDDLANVINANTLTDEITEAFIDVANGLIDGENTDAWRNSTSGAEKVLSAMDAFTDALSERLSISNQTKQVIAKTNIGSVAYGLQCFCAKQIIAGQNNKNIVEVKKIAPNTDFVFPYVGETDEYTEAWVRQTSTSVELSSENFPGNTSYITRASIYRDISEILPTTENNQRNSTIREINGPIVALSIHQSPVRSLNSPVTIIFEHSKRGLRNATCNFWMFNSNGTGYWSTEGCNVISSNDTITECQCDHLTNFAVLMSPFRAADPDSLPLRIISLVGIGVSVLGLVTTMILHLRLWRHLKSDRVTILMNLCIALIVSYVIFIGGIDRTESRGACIAVTAMLQYIYLVVFFIMLTQGIQISTVVLSVFYKKSRVNLLLVLAWALPSAIVGVSLGITKAEGYGTADFCWLSSENGLVWAFVGPALLIITINVVCLIIVFRAMFTTKAMAQKRKIEKLKTSVRSLCVLIPLMGVTWVVGILHINNTFYWIQYMFAVCNGLQGFFIFLIHCVFNEKLKRALETRQRRRSAKTLSSPTTKKGFISKTSKQVSRSSRNLSNTNSRSKDGGKQPSPRETNDLDFNPPLYRGSIGSLKRLSNFSPNKHDSGLGGEAESSPFGTPNPSYAFYFAGSRL